MFGMSWVTIMVLITIEALRRIIGEVSLYLLEFALARGVGVSAWGLISVADDNALHNDDSAFLPWIIGRL